MDKIIHIVSPEPPYPIIHGGRFDLFYKLVAFREAGIQVHLHCFTASKDHEPELEKYCSSVHYYPRKRELTTASSLPYIVRSRRSKELLSNLLKDDHPILFEGVHSTDVLNHHDFEDRRLVLRLHNIEHIYYRRLFSTSNYPFKKIYYFAESVLLKWYEKKVAKKISIALAVSRTDASFYKKQFPNSQVEFMPVFVDFKEMPATAGNYCLYHGNLSVAENEAAVRYLVKDVFNGLNIPLLIAGLNPSRSLGKWLTAFSFVTLVKNPSHSQLELMIAAAKVNVLPSMNSTGVKLKLIHAVFAGGHCVTNTAGVAGSDLEPFCAVANNTTDFIAQVKQFYQTPLTAQQRNVRAEAVRKIYDMKRNADRISQMIW